MGSAMFLISGLTLGGLMSSITWIYKHVQYMQVVIQQDQYDYTKQRIAEESFEGLLISSQQEMARHQQVVREMKSQVGTVEQELRGYIGDLLDKVTARDKEIAKLSGEHPKVDAKILMEVF